MENPLNHGMVEFAMADTIGWLARNRGPMQSNWNWSFHSDFFGPPVERRIPEGLEAINSGETMLSATRLLLILENALDKFYTAILKAIESTRQRAAQIPEKERSESPEALWLAHWDSAILYFQNEVRAEVQHLDETISSEDVECQAFKRAVDQIYAHDPPPSAARGAPAPSAPATS